VSPPPLPPHENAHVGNLIPDVMVLEGGAFGKWLGQEDGALNIKMLITGERMRDICRLSPVLAKIL